MAVHWEILVQLLGILQRDMWEMSAYLKRTASEILPRNSKQAMYFCVYCFSFSLSSNLLALGNKLAAGHDSVIYQEAVVIPSDPHERVQLRVHAVPVEKNVVDPAATN